jgi:hypothetical protein
MAATRIAPAPSNGGTDDGTLYMEAILAEIAALWRVTPEWLDGVAGTANAIIATSDTAVVSQVTDNGAAEIVLAGAGAQQHRTGDDRKSTASRRSRSSTPTAWR